MYETTNIMHHMQSTTSQLLVIPQDYQQRRFDYLTVFSPVIYFGENEWAGVRVYNSYAIRFLNTFVFNVNIESDYITIQNADLDIELSVHNLSEVVPSLIDELVFLWNTYALEDDSNLTQDAIALKNEVYKIFILEQGPL